jgi:hypothetical protein
MAPRPGRAPARSGVAGFDDHFPLTVRGCFAFSIFFGRIGPDRPERVPARRRVLASPTALKVQLPGPAMRS